MQPIWKKKTSRYCTKEKLTIFCSVFKKILQFFYFDRVWRRNSIQWRAPWVATKGSRQTGRPVPGRLGATRNIPGIFARPWRICRQITTVTGNLKISLLIRCALAFYSFEDQVVALFYAVNIAKATGFTLNYSTGVTSWLSRRCRRCFLLTSSSIGSKNLGQSWGSQKKRRSKKW